MDRDRPPTPAEIAAGRTSIPDAASRKKAKTSAADLRAVAKGSLVQFAGKGANRMAGLLFVAIAIRLLGAAGFGLYRQVAQLLMTTSLVATLGFDSALLRTIAQARARNEQGVIREAMRTALTTVTIVSIVLVSLFLFATGPIASAFVDSPSQWGEMAFLLRFGAAFIPAFALARVISIGTMGFKTVVPAVLIGDVLQPVSLLIFSTVVLVAGYGVRGAVAALLMSAVVALATAAWSYRKLLPVSQRQSHSSSSFRSMAGFALPRAGARALRWGSLGTLLLGMLGTDRDVTLFAVAISLQGLVLIFPQAFLSIWQPIVVDLVERRETERLGSIYQTVNRWVASFSFGLIIALVLLPEPFVQLLGGSDVRGATLVTSIIALGTLVQVGTGLCGMLVTMAGYPTINLVNSIGVFALYVLAAWFFVPKHGVMGMSVIHATAATLSNIMMAIAARWLTGLQPFGRSFLKPMAASCVGGLVLLLWRVLVVRSLPLDLLGLALSGAIYCGSLWVAGMDDEDRIVYERGLTRLRGILPGR